MPKVCPPGLIAKWNQTINVAHVTGRGKPLSKKGYLSQARSCDSSAERQRSNHTINLPGCCSHVPPLLLLLKEHRVSIVRLLDRVIELTNGMWIRYTPRLSIWDLCTAPVVASAAAATNHHALSTNTAQGGERTLYRCKPLGSLMIPSHETKLHVRKQKACLFYK